ncbi:putative Flp pilus-assembly TadE/G-like protein [Novosphingobium kunmingense]|uniref:Putative Flp pilus-assembly TadE/G-like protein n=2 Tax=Novosphingobium kunmingense TaxID=1211806 RepID=A0A2N0I2R9_9SPHN|nr:putative Flp pilus-assembly TadE/G-like protein [Novosphingobium kunmingense]
MLNSFKRSMERLKRQTSGNATMLVAAGLPALIGAAGLGVDTAQWYMWKREMQYAADQAALAGAWSLVGGSQGTSYVTRAKQELSANLQQVTFAGTPTVNTAKWLGSSVDNSVVVSFSASKKLPFSSFLTQKGVTISARAQAVYQQGRSFTSCLIAVDPETRGAITIGGNAYIVTGCGAAALSDNEESVIKNGNAVFEVGWIVSQGGIDSDFDDGKTELWENQTDLSDPFAKLTPPDNPTPQTLTCTTGSTVYTAAVTVTTDRYSQVMTSTNGNSWKTSGSRVLLTHATDTRQIEVAKQARVGQKVIDNNSTEMGTVTLTKSGYTRTDIITVEVGTIASIAEKTLVGGAYPKPGTYSGFQISCDTTMAKGVYVIDGGVLSINATNKLIGDGVMFVLKNGAGIRINGSSNVFLRPMTYEEMVAPEYGNMSGTQATALKDMLIFEDRNSVGDDNDKINGTAGMVINGTVYLPKSKLTFDGTTTVTLGCFVIAAAQIVIEGTAHMERFCATTDDTGGVVVGGSTDTVRLVK